MTPTFRALRLAAASGMLGLGGLSGCSSVGDWFSHRDPSSNSLNIGANPPLAAHLPANPAEKPTVLPVASQDITCPEVAIPEGGAYLRVGGAENASVRYQFNIEDTARQCDPAGQGQASITIGVRGAVVVGPAGGAGSYSAPLRIVVIRDSDKTEVFSKTYKVEATTDGVRAGGFKVVTEPIPLPLPNLQLADQYTISVGFAAGGEGAPQRHTRKTSG